MQFAEVAGAPMPQGLAGLLRRLADDGAEHSGEGKMEEARQRRGAVLLVEDDAELRRLTASLLEEEFDTVECESAEAALATMLIRGRDIAMIFADINLPGVMDGIDLASEVRMRWPLLPVILTSGLPRERVRDLPLGVDYIAKPWQPLSLLIAAEQALASGAVR
jgi:CheY-like chemotaxis protein